jgi:hypothetical protein
MLSTIIRYVRRHHVGFLALAVALAGTAYAANKVGPKDIKTNAVHSRHIKNGQVRARDLGPTRTITRMFTISDTTAGDGNPGYGGGNALCPHHGRAVGGSAGWLNSAPNIEAIHSFNIEGQGVFGAGNQDTGTTQRFQVTVVCLRR